MQRVTNKMDKIIYSYTRKDAIDDGVLVDVTETASEAGIILPTALTDTVWENCVEWDKADADRKQIHQDMDGRLWDVLYMAYHAIRNNPTQSVLRYKLYRVPRCGVGRKAREITLKIMCGPGDQGEPVLTIMMTEED